MNLERDLEYSERSTRSKKILIFISVILLILSIASLFGFIRERREHDSLGQQLITIQKEREIIQQNLAEMGKENETLKHQLASITEERDRLANEIASRKAPPSKKAIKTTPPSKAGSSGTKK